MRIFHDERQRRHAPALELHNGGFTAYAETPARAEAMLAVLGATETPPDRGDAAVRAVHDANYLDFLQRAPELWRAAGRPGEAIPYAFPVVGRRPLDLKRIDALMGRYSFDATTPITADAYSSSYWSAQSALAATQAVLGGERVAFALCRPPGHHAGADYCGGYCHINAAAVTTQALVDAGRSRVAVLDIDYNHGNGTQDIFLTRGDVFYASVHADPATDYPFFWGHADEVGEGEGRDTTLNLPLPHGTAMDAFRRAQATALDAIARFAPDALVVSFGADTWIGDPISQFALETPDYALLARDIAGCAWPTAIVMEGGYAVDALGHNVASFLSGF
ncbi:MAG TPA: histone deacetylase family protein [Sphingomonas sp.]|jgi:acetoin utilization deacetylase AcuC-like enzyme|uniref:histone deacetylase family protein n=1 Tax=Sphingomonas sp. TaxID=28214 RepID=UPI002ED82430